MTVIENFIIINFGILFINLIISAILWIFNKNNYYRSLFFVWLMCIVSYIIQGIFTQNDFLIALGFSSAFLINISLSHLLLKITDITLPWKFFVGLLLLGYVITILGYFLQLDFILMALPIALAVSFPAIFSSLKVLITKWRFASISLRGLTITIFLLALHNIDFAFFRNVESLAPVGFIIALFIVFCLSIFTPAVVLEVLADKISILQQDKVNTQQRAIEKMERIDDLKDEFLANTSHELKTPLHGIIGLSESLLDMSGTVSTDSLHHNLQLIAASGKRLSSLVDDILVFAQLKNEELSLDLQPLKLKSVVDVVINISRPLVGTKDIVLLNSVPADLPPVWVDENRFQQILFNLVGNAIKYTDSGQVEVTALAEKNQARIAVADTGIGIEKDQQRLVFNTFEQLGESKNRSRGGVGLGLSITKKLVELHTGQIEVESEPGKGSTFIVTIPLAQDQPAIPTHRKQEDMQVIDERASAVLPVTPMEVTSHRHPAAEISAGMGTFNILSVDDDPINQQVLENYLSDSRYVIQRADSGQSAFELIRENGKPDLILLDIMMPGMSGFEFCKHLREDYDAQNLPVIFLSAKNQISDIVEGFNLGGNDYIKKPFNKNELLARMQNCLYLLKAGEKLISLRDLGSQLGKIKTQQHMLTTILKEFYQYIFSCQVTLFRENKLVEQLPSDGINPLLTEHLSEEKQREIFVNSTEEIVCHQSLDNILLKTQQRLFYIRINGFDEYQIRVLTDHGNPLVHKNEIEYIRNIIRELKAIRSNLTEIVSDWNVLEGIFQIRQKLEDVLYIKSQAPYCCIVYDAQEKNILVLRTPIQNLDIFFEDHILTRIHRSYLINPKKMLSFQRKGTQDYEALLQDSSGNKAAVPVGRSYHATIKRLEKTRLT